jgi:hypothetical protein
MKYDKIICWVAKRHEKLMKKTFPEGNITFVDSVDAINQKDDDIVVISISKITSKSIAEKVKILRDPYFLGKNLPWKYALAISIGCSEHKYPIANCKINSSMFDNWKNKPRRYNTILWWVNDSYEQAIVEMKNEKKYFPILFANNFSSFKEGIKKNVFIVCSIANVNGHYKELKSLIENYSDFTFYFHYKVANDDGLITPEEISIDSLKNTIGPGETEVILERYQKESKIIPIIR